MGEEQTRRCPRCGADYGADVRLCIECGIDLITGLEFQPVVEVEQPAEEPEAVSTGLRALQFFGTYFPGLFRPRILITSILLMGAGLAALAFSISIILMGAIFAAVAMGAGGLILYAQAVVWIQAGYFGIIHDLMADFQGHQWTVFFALVFGPIGTLILIMFAVGPQ